MNTSKQLLKRWVGPLLCGLAVALPVVFFLLLMTARQTGLESKLELLDQLRRLSRPGNLNEVSVAELGNRGRLLFHEGQTPDVIAANFLTMAKQSAANQSLEIVRSGNLPLQEEFGISWATVFMDISGRESAVYIFLREIETAKPFLFVTRFEMRSSFQTGTEQFVEMPMTVSLAFRGAIKPSQGQSVP